MKKLGKYNLLEENVCHLHCDCGWNITIGGKDKEDLANLKRYLKGEPLKVEFFTKNKKSFK